MNRNGEKEDGEPPLAGAEIRVKNANHELMGFWVTQASGTYVFTKLQPGLYYVSETDPPGYGSTTIGEIAVYLNANQSLPVHFGDYALPTATPTSTPTSTPVLDWHVYLPVVVSRH